MRMVRALVVVSSALFVALSGELCLALAAEAPWQQRCEKYKDLTPPSADQPTAGEVAGPLKGCQSETLYYGIGMAADPAQARKCAFVEAATGLGVFGGNDTLMVIYANGVGATRNLPLALHYACRLQGADAEMEGRVQHLEKLLASSWSGHDFELCQDITSGFMMGHCAAHSERMAAVARAQRMQRIAAAMPVANQAAFARLQAASDGFIKARVEHEVDQSGTARGMFMVQEEGVLREDYLQMLEAFAKGKGHHYSEAEAKTKAADLGTLLRRIQEADPEAQKGWGSVDANGIKQTQAAWIAYRDAFAAYASARDPRVNAASVSAWLTAKRIHMLKSISGY